MKLVFLYYAFAGVSPVSKNVSIESSKYRERLNSRLRVTIFGTAFQYIDIKYKPFILAGEQNITAPKNMW